MDKLKERTKQTLNEPKMEMDGRQKSDSGLQEEVKSRATFALKYNKSCACILKGSVACAFSYLQGACVELHLCEAGDENKDEGKTLVPR